MQATMPIDIPLMRAGASSRTQITMQAMVAL